MGDPYIGPLHRETARWQNELRLGSFLGLCQLQTGHSEAVSDVGGVEEVGGVEAELSGFLKQLQNLPDPRLTTAFLTLRSVTHAQQETVMGGRRARKNETELDQLQTGRATKPRLRPAHAITTLPALCLNGHSKKGDKNSAPDSDHHKFSKPILKRPS